MGETTRFDGAGASSEMVVSAITQLATAAVIHLPHAAGVAASMQAVASSPSKSASMPDA